MKLELNDVAGGYNLEKINSNFQKIAQELDQKVLYRDNPGSTPNQMKGDLDMNGFQILNSGSVGGGGGATEARNVSFDPPPGLDSENVQDAIVEVAAAIPVPALNTPQPTSPVAGSIGTTIGRYALEDHVHFSSGSGGGGGEPAYSNALVYAYKRAASLPADNPGTVTWNFAVGAIVIPASDALANGWTKTIPTGTLPLYVTVASASSTATTDTIAGNEFSTPVVLAQDGGNGLNVATVFIYQRTTVNTAPSLPSVNATYQFTPASLTGLNNGWVTSVPAIGGGSFLWTSTATAVANTTTDTITPSEWAAAQIMAQNGANGSNGSPGATGSNGVDGRRGTLIVAQGGYTSWNDSAATSAITSLGYGGPYDRDQVTLYGTGFSQTRFYSSGSWLVLTAYINGNLLVSGTLSAAVINGGTLTGVQIKIGTGSTPSGGAFEVTASGTVWCDAYNGGRISVGNNGTPSVPAITGNTGSFSGSFGVQGQVEAGNSNGNAAGLKGVSFYSGTSGLVGPNGTFDFYANGTGTNYGPFTGAHDSLVDKDESVEVGDILVDVSCASHGRGVSNTIFITTRSNTSNQKAAIGVVATPLTPLLLSNPPAAFTIDYGPDWVPIIDPNYPNLVDEYNRGAVNAVGEGMLNVVGEGGNIEAGDLIVTSSVPGKGMKQSDDIVRGYTVAKAREGATFVAGEIKQIACIYLCG